MFKKYRYVFAGVFLALTVAFAILIPKVKINYNSMEYLPEDSKTKAAYEIMKNEFSINGSLNIMIDNIENIEEIEFIKVKLLIDNVENIDYVTKYDKVLFSLTLTSDDYEQETMAVIDELSTILNDLDYTFYMNGQSFLTYNYNNILKEQIPRIISFLIPVILIILFLMTKSVMEPVLFVVVVLVSVVLNLGSNVFLSNISYMTYSIAAILQFAICMDYSIMLFNRFQDFKKEEKDSLKAMNKAWKSSLLPILSSSLTTVAGFVAIMFMKYKIGLDIGLVLIKGVILTLLTVLFLLPSLILIFEKIIDKTTHVNFSEFLKIKTKSKNKTTISNFNYKTRLVLPFIALALYIGAFFIQNNNSFHYSDNATTQDMAEINYNDSKIKEHFALNSQVVLLLKEEGNISDFLADLSNVELEGENYISDILAFDKQLTIEEFTFLTKDYRLEENEVLTLFSLINGLTSKETISFRELLLLIENLQIARPQQEMLYFLGNIIPIEESSLAFLYNLSNKETLSVLEIFNFIKTDYIKTEMSIIFDGLLSTEQLDIVYETDTAINLITLFTRYNTFLNKSSNATTMKSALPNLSIEEINGLYNIVGETELSLKDLVIYFSGYFSEEEIALIFSDFDPVEIQQIFYGLVLEDKIVEGKVTLIDFIEFILVHNNTLPIEEKAKLTNLKNNLLEINFYLPLINLIETLSPTLSMASLIDLDILNNFQNSDLIQSQFIGENYQRVVFSVTLPEESDLSFTYFEKIKNLLSESFEDYYLLSATSTVMDIKETSNKDLIITTIISISLIFLILAFSFKSLIIPALLILLIEGAIFINMSIPALMNQPIILTGYILVSCIQLGATIDYAILVTHRYRENRKLNNKKDSLTKTVNESINPISTSGLILTVAGFLLGIISPIPVVSLMGKMLGFGGFISMTAVLFVLPQALYLTDKALLWKMKFKKSNTKE